MKGLPQLRVRTEYSFRSCYGPVARVAERLEEIGCPAAGIVDTSGTWGHVDWERHVPNPMFGAELVFERGDLKPRAWVLAEDLAAFYRLTSNPPQDPNEMANAAGVIRFAGAALTDPETFDYIDVNPRSRRRTRQALALARHTGKPLVVTSDNDYPGPEDRDRFLAWDDSLKMTPQYILAEEELRRALPDLDDETFRSAVRNCHEVAERLQGIKLRKAPLISVPGDIRELVESGRQYRLERGHIAEWTEEYQARLERELALIHEKQFESYFIVVADMVTWAKERMLVGPARGSSAGSLVCYLLRITEVDPIVHGLLFERFIDVNRADLPDIDIDFNDQKRELVFDYLREKYGHEHVARIGSINRLKARSVVAHVGKKLGIPHGAAFGMLNVLIEHSSGDSRYGKGLEDTINGTKPGQDFIARYPEAALMGELELHASHTGQHAAGIIVSNEPVLEYCTVRDGIAQVDKEAAEYLNLLKIDALGLRTLGVIEDAGCVTPQQLYDLTLDDPRVFDVVNSGKFSGVFQFEGASQRRVARQIEVKSFRELDHITALARPGPLGGGATGSYIERTAGREPITYKHPSMAEYLAETQGVVVYQEQVMRIVRELGKFSWEKTSVIRKAMSGRKGAEFFNRLGEEFVAGAAESGLSAQDAKELWDSLIHMGAWSMNKCMKHDTKVKLCHANGHIGPTPTLKELHDYYKVNPSRWVRQRKSMPVLMAMGEDGVAVPRKAKDIIKTGVKPCVRLTFADGRVVECTADHKFIINGRWMRCGDAAPGDIFVDCARHHHIKNHKFDEVEDKGRGWRAGRSGGAGDSINKRTPIKEAFRAERLGTACDDCGKVRKRMEVHHNDHCHGKERPHDLAWLCSGCHKKRHMDAGDWLPPYGRGWQRARGAQLVSVEDIGEHETYDIEMPDPDHNYVLANGIVTHNSHTVSYAIISYWCAYMKAYHPLEYAAACLRHAKDDTQVVELLRELDQEGIPFTPFDPDASEVNWSVKDGRLLGGFSILRGIGPVKAAAYLAKREAGQLTDEDRAKLAALPPKIDDLYPGRTLWGEMYDHPEKFNINGKVKLIADLEDQENAVIICRLVRLDRRDHNEAMRLAKRGYALKGQTLFLDAFVVDDSVAQPVSLRIRSRDWHRVGEPMADKAKPGDWFLVRGTWLAQFSMMSATKVKCLTNPEMFS